MNRTEKIRELAHILRKTVMENEEDFEIRASALLFCFTALMYSPKAQGTREIILEITKEMCDIFESLLKGENE
jgi:hypothetical protein